MEYREYLCWARSSALIEAPKVELASISNCSNVEEEFKGDPDEDSQRGLFATETIHPGERIIAIPASSLIEEGVLRRQGRCELERLQAGKAIWSSPLKPLPPEVLERRIAALIEDIHHSVSESVENLGFGWRNDDFVALYLIACRHLINNFVQRESQDVTVVPITLATPILDEAGVAQEGLMPESAIESTAVIDAEPASFLPHIAMLPSSFPTQPLYFHASQLERIEGTNCHGYTTRLLNQMKSDWLQLCQILEKYYLTTDTSKNVVLSSSYCGQCYQCHNDMHERGCRAMLLTQFFTFDMYKWALSCIYSRSTDFQLEHGKHHRVIAPLFDMMNHDFESNVTHSLYPDGTLSVFNGSDRSIEQGEEICLSYGAFSNEKLLLIYGFVIPENPFDAVSIFAPMSSSDPLFCAKARILEQRCGIADTNEPHQMCNIQRLEQNPIIPDSLLSVLRVIGVQSAEELATLAKRTEDDGKVPMISIENEQAALLALHNALYNLSRQLALNLISDTSLQGTFRPYSSSEEAEMPGNQKEEITLDRSDSISAGFFDVLNTYNCRTLCQSEYDILQAALAELGERLAALEGFSLESQQ